MTAAEWQNPATGSIGATIRGIGATSRTAVGTIACAGHSGDRRTLPGRLHTAHTSVRDRAASWCNQAFHILKGVAQCDARTAVRSTVSSA